jgi:hypothetical protein
MKKVAIVAVSNFIYAEDCLKNTARFVDQVYVRFDNTNGDPEILRSLQSWLGNKLGDVYISSAPWTVPNWKEDCLRMLDDVKPDVVLFPDEDEMFEDGLFEELEKFMASDKKAMMFSYRPLETNVKEDISQVPYPDKPHMKVFKWEKNLTYFPYHRNACLAKYINKSLWWNACTKIKHYCGYTKELRAMKKWRNDVEGHKASKPVTILGFGPSATGDLSLLGEVWSLNNCYEILPVDVMKYVTRIYEMHKWDKRDHYIVKDGREHFWHLNELGKMGHRIVMQEESPLIYNSEAYPLFDVEAKLGFKFWSGTVCYMIAQAVFEGFTEIRLYGFDQMDWEHISQREACTGWIMYALGRGVKVSGVLTFLSRHNRRYGYDWGPEWDEEAQKEFWRGWPFEIKFKDAPRAIKGDMK